MSRRKGLEKATAIITPTSPTVPCVRPCRGRKSMAVTATVEVAGKRSTSEHQNRRVFSSCEGSRGTTHPRGHEEPSRKATDSTAGSHGWRGANRPSPSLAALKAVEKNGGITRLAAYLRFEIQRRKSPEKVLSLGGPKFEASILVTNTAGEESRCGRSYARSASACVQKLQQVLRLWEKEVQLDGWLAGFGSTAPAKAEQHGETSSSRPGSNKNWSVDA
ncbi:hypothetical protein AXG93_3789s1040 [Marchantia polymorpha subsp. ruderalis]|uniref:Uncharacterized protein n=1 Tax=Marchantia polymorpha subsp. ruderalis TaxID=1480154 RepID=A0A176WEM0_MARPO|nr:hypothetical protein AXG93_3789s1040 [Marchantia polymorpha subsp. ruderalis]